MRQNTEKRREEVARRARSGLRAVIAAAVVAVAVLTTVASSADASLPDQRRYELVSPADKRGIDVVAQSNKVHVSADRTKATFNALGGFADVRGTSVDVQYLSRRDGVPNTNGWTTRAITPKSAALSFYVAVVFQSNIPTFETEFTPDLSAAVFRSWRPLTDDPNVDGVSNLYRLGNLDGAGSPPQLLTHAASPLPSLGLGSLFLRPAFVGASTDLRHVAFESQLDLVGDGSTFAPRLYEYADDGGVRLVGRIPTGGATECDDSSSGSPCEAAPSSQAGIQPSSPTVLYSTDMVSANGSRILFQVPSGALGGAIYMREDGTRTVQLNASEKTSPESPQDAELWDMSRDGTRIFFTTSEGLVNDDNDGASDLYMYDTAAPAGAHLTRLSVSGTGVPHVVQDVIGASDDGHYVYFVCLGQLVPGEPPIDSGGLFVWHDGQIRYIGRAAGGFAFEVNTPRTIWNFDQTTRASRITPDGRHLLFTSQNDVGFRGRGGFAGYDQSACTSTIGPGCRELYLYDANTGSLACASCNPRASAATGDAYIDVRVNASASANTQHLSHALSDDGNRVFFSTPEAMVPEDTNGRWDAYEYDAVTRTVHLLSTGKSTSDSYFMEASPRGEDAFFVTRERLVGWDVDDNYDLYDARIGGGFPEPAPAVAPCTGDQCRGAASAAPTPPSSASAQFKGAGDVKAKLKKPKHKRCRAVRKSHHRAGGKRKCAALRHIRSRSADSHGRWFVRPGEEGLVTALLAAAFLGLYLVYLLLTTLRSLFAKGRS
ncbi:MAG: hypothetical protein ACTHOE_11405 [Conexibacter sp.]